MKPGSIGTARRPWLSARRKGLLLVCAIAAMAYAYWKLAIPVHRVKTRSELIMRGDVDRDGKWAATDLHALENVLRDPYAVPNDIALRIDLNQNGLLDEEDLKILRALVECNGDPYTAEERERAEQRLFPRPRELFRFMPVAEYRPRPMWALPYPGAASSPLKCLRHYRQTTDRSPYFGRLEHAVYAEAVRFDLAWRRRESRLLPMEREYADRKLRRADVPFDSGDYYELLLAIIELVEDAETLTTRNQPQFVTQFLVFRDHLREILGSPLYSDFQAGKRDWRAVLKPVSAAIRTDLGLSYDLEHIGKPRNLTSLENYVQRAEWQYYKSSAREEDFQALIEYAQQDPRYLRAVARTQRKLQDPTLQNHNLPMVLLFREALRIKAGDKKRAVGLLDEAIRIPYAWIRQLPREALPGSVALDNFLLPGNKEDSADKSRHWNVFGGICLYKSPQKALDLALKREMQDLRDEEYSQAAMREFFRDMIANLNGMYHVVAINPQLLAN